MGPPPGQPYPGLIRPGTPGPVPSGSIPPGMPSRQTTPTPVATGVPPAGSVGPGPNAPITPGAPIQPQQQQPGQQQPLGPYPQPYGPPGQAPNQQPRQPSFGTLLNFYKILCSTNVIIAPAVTVIKKFLNDWPFLSCHCFVQILMVFTGHLMVRRFQVGILPAGSVQVG